MASTNAERKSQRRGLRLTLSLRTLIVLVLVIGGGLGWIDRQARSQRRAVKAIDFVAGKVQYDFEWTDTTTNPPTPPRKPWPKPVADAIGIDYLSSVVQVHVAVNLFDQEGYDIMAELGHLDHLRSLNLCWSRRVTDEGLAHLRGLSQLRELDLSNTGIKGPGLACLAGMTNLRILHLDATNTDADLAHIAGLTRLETLELDSPNITDAGLAHLKRLNLKALRLNSSHITTAGLGHLRGMKRLEELKADGSRIDSLEPLRNLASLKSLSLSMTPITDAGLAPVANFAELEGLSLAYTSIGDETLVHVGHLTKLDNLNFAGTHLTDAGLANLSGLKSLKSLSLDYTSVTDAGLAHLAGLTGGGGLTVKRASLRRRGAASF